MPAHHADECQFSSCMYATCSESSVTSDESVSSVKRPIAAVPGRPRPRPGCKKATYRHVPHRDKPPQLVARRNARERRRVQAVNAAFVRLRQAVPGDTPTSRYARQSVLSMLICRSCFRSKRVSKVKTLQRAIEYICFLQQLLSSAAETDAPPRTWISGAADCIKEEDDFASFLQDLTHQF